MDEATTMKKHNDQYYKYEVSDPLGIASMAAAADLKTILFGLYHQYKEENVPPERCVVESLAPAAEIKSK